MRPRNIIIAVIAVAAAVFLVNKLDAAPRGSFDVPCVDPLYVSQPAQDIASSYQSAVQVGQHMVLDVSRRPFEEQHANQNSRYPVSTVQQQVAPFAQRAWHAVAADGTHGADGPSQDR